MNIESRQWKPQDLLDNLQKMIDEEPDDYCNERRWTLCTARDYLKQYFMQPDEPLVMEDFTIVGESEKQTAGGGTLMDYERLIARLKCPKIYSCPMNGEYPSCNICQKTLNQEAVAALTALLDEITQLKRERDAAIEDLNKLRKKTGWKCEYCYYSDNYDRDICCGCEYNNDNNWEWRGAQKEER